MVGGPGPPEPPLDPPLDLGTNIAIPEMKALIAGLYVGQHVNREIYCINVDNESVCTFINRGFSRMQELQDGMREIVYLAEIHNFEIFMVHIQGKKNLIPDLLS